MFVSIWDKKTYPFSWPFQSLCEGPLCFHGSGWSLGDQEFQVCQPGPCEEGREPGLSPSTGLCCPTCFQFLQEKKEKCGEGEWNVMSVQFFTNGKRQESICVWMWRAPGGQGERAEGWRDTLMFQGKIFSLEFSIRHASLWPAAYSTHSFRLTSKPFRHFGHVWLFEFCLKLLGLLLAIHLMLMFFLTLSSSCPLKLLK